MSPDDDDLPSIDTPSLAAVTGGTASNDDVTSAVTALSNDLKDFLANQKKGSSDFFSQMLPFLLMLGGGGGGFSCAAGGGCCGRCGCSPCRCRR
jgi:hypothetical protein